MQSNFSLEQWIKHDRTFRIVRHKKPAVNLVHETIVVLAILVAGYIILYKPNFFTAVHLMPNSQSAAHTNTAKK